MSLGQPNLYLAGALVAGTTAGPRHALAGVTINWGNDSRIDFAGPATLSGEILVRSALPAWANGTQVGLVDPVSGRCLFAGHITNLTARRDEQIKSALRVTFTATSPLADLKNHTIYDFDWAFNSTQAQRFSQLAGSIARGWSLQGYNGALFNWIDAGRLKFDSHNWLDLAGFYCRSIRARYHDTSAFVPGSGLIKRLRITDEREKTAPAPPGAGTTEGAWYTSSKPANATGIAALPAGLIARDVEWEKNPDDTITDVKLSTWGGAVVADGEESDKFDLWMEAHGVNNHALQDKYGFRQLSLETDVSLAVGGAVDGWIQQLVAYWLDADTAWRPQAVGIPDGGKVNTAAMLNLLAVDTRHMAALYVPAGEGITPGKIHAYVTKGNATWTGKKWTANLTLGRTFD